MNHSKKYSQSKSDAYKKDLIYELWPTENNQTTSEQAKITEAS